MVWRALSYKTYMSLGLLSPLMLYFYNQYPYTFTRVYHLTKLTHMYYLYHNLYPNTFTRVWTLVTSVGKARSYPTTAITHTSLLEFTISL